MRKTFYFEFLGIEDNQAQFAWWIEPREATDPISKYAPVNAVQVLRRMGTFLKQNLEGKVKTLKLMQDEEFISVGNPPLEEA